MNKEERDKKAVSEHMRQLAKRRAESLTPERRSEIASKASRAYWDKVKKEDE